jgi:hypothetical protein
MEYVDYREEYMMDRLYKCNTCYWYDLYDYRCTHGMEHDNLIEDDCPHYQED